MEAVLRFARIASRPERNVELDRGALAIAAGADPDLDITRWMGELDRIADGIGSIGELRGRLFFEMGFAGDTETYEDPSNSFLHRVIERRRGIPITLSVLMIETARRVGIELEGVGMPGHFLVRDPKAGAIYDPFGGGEQVDRAACERLFRAAMGAGTDVRFTSKMLATAGPRTILARMLANLKTIYTDHKDPKNLEWVLLMRMALPEVPGDEALELADLVGGVGRFSEGARALEERAEAIPQLGDRLRTAARVLRARLN